MTLRVLLLLLTTVLWASSARADPTPFAGVRGGFAEQVHGGGVSFEGSGATLAVEGGLRLQPGLRLFLAVERGPHLARYDNAFSVTQPARLRDHLILAIVETEHDRFLFAGGIGVVLETITSLSYTHDLIGPLYPYYVDQTRTGVIGVVRGAVRLTSDSPQVHVVVQLTAQTISDNGSYHAYGASVGMAVRWP